jgi:hypothetical protein
MRSTNSKIILIFIAQLLISMIAGSFGAYEELQKM